MSQFCCYLVCLLAAVGHFLDCHHLIVAHISGLLDDKHNHQYFKHLIKPLFKSGLRREAWPHSVTVCRSYRTSVALSSMLLCIHGYMKQVNFILKVFIFYLTCYISHHYFALWFCVCVCVGAVMVQVRRQERNGPYFRSGLLGVSRPDPEPTFWT